MTMAVTQVPGKDQDYSAKRDAVGEWSAFDMQQEMDAAMRLMANPAAGVMALSALGFGLASQAFGLWAGAVTGAAQASQRLLSPVSPREQASELEAAKPMMPPTREKPALKVVAKNEPVNPAPTASVEPVAAKPTNPVAEPAKPSPIVAEQGLAAKVDPIAPAKPTKSVAAAPAKADAALQPEDFHKPHAIERPAAPDDLKAISGIGPKLEKVLNDLGVWTYAQIAAWQKREVAWLDDYLGFKGRIDRDGWIAQARGLSGPSKAKGK
jgi:NADH-quinone oxidoreductase subunit E